MEIKEPLELDDNNTSVTIETCYCRKCMRTLPAKEFYKAVDNGLIDSNGKLSICKKCSQEIYNIIYAETQSIEKTLHKMCTSLNIKFSNEAVNATKAHIKTMHANGKNLNAIFAVFLTKLVATNPSMDKNIKINMTYEDVGTIYVAEQINIKEIPIPDDVIKFWGTDVSREDIQYLEREYSNFKQTNKADTYPEIVLLQQVCYTLLNIKNARKAGDDAQKDIKQLQELMKNLAISPNITNNTSTDNKNSVAIGIWIKDVEMYEPCVWLKTDPRGDLYRDVGNTEEYFQNYTVRPLKNLMTTSKDFNLFEEADDDMFDETDTSTDYGLKDENE